MSKLVTVYGGSGFVGRHIVRRLAKDGWRVRVAVRRPNEAHFVKPYGAVGQVEPIFCNIRDDDSVRAAMHGSDAAINCVGILAPVGANGFDAVQHEGAERIARIAAELGVDSVVSLSAIGADKNSKSAYSRTKALGEEGVLQHRPDAVILRPSVVFGPEDGFFNRFALMARFGPILPVVGAQTKFQPVYVDDVAQAAVLAVNGTAEAGIYELGGPDAMSLRDLMQTMLGVIRRNRLILNLPFFAAHAMGIGFDLVRAMSLGLVKGPITNDQVYSLQADNVVSEGALSFKELNISPVPFETVLPSYLWRFRPSGQYDAIKESAENLRVD